MKLRNKKTGEIVEFGYLQSDHVAPLVLTTYENDRPEMMYTYNSLTELNEEWEDYEEPKEYWFISDMGQVHKFGDCYGELVVDEKQKEIGNYFETKEDAEKAVEKLKAIKRLKDKGFKFNGWVRVSKDLKATLEITAKVNDFEIYDDLDLLFGGEE